MLKLELHHMMSMKLDDVDDVDDVDETRVASWCTPQTDVHHLTICGAHLLCTMKLVTSACTALLATDLRPVTYRALIIASCRRVCGHDNYVYSCNKYTGVELASCGFACQLHWRSLRHSWLPT